MKAQGFWNDKDGMTSDDLEKIVLLCLSIACVIIGLIMYIKTGDITPNFVYLTIGILTLMVTRKGLSYLKPERYYGKNTTADIVKANNPEIMNNGYGTYGNYGYDTTGYGTGYNTYGTNTTMDTTGLNTEIINTDTTTQTNNDTTQS